MDNAAPDITHEQEAQRQHIRLRMPSMVEIEGSAYPVADIGAGGLAIHGIINAPRKKSRIPLRLTFPFEEFSLTTTLDAEIRHTDKKRGITGWRFSDPGAVQSSVLSHVMRAYIGGDVVAANDVLRAAQNGSGQWRKASTPPRHTLAATLRGGFIYLLFIAAASFISVMAVQNVLKRFFVIATPYASAVQEHIVLPAPSSGIYAPAIPAGQKEVARHSIIGTMTPAFAPSGMAALIKSPCDCTITGHHATPGLYAAEGSPLLTLTPRDADVHVEAFVPQQHVHKIKIGSTAIITIAGEGKTYAGIVTHIDSSTKFVPSSAGSTAEPSARLTIVPDDGKAISTTLAGRPAYVEIRL